MRWLTVVYANWEATARCFSSVAMEEPISMHGSFIAQVMACLDWSLARLVVVGSTTSVEPWLVIRIVCKLVRKMHGWLKFLVFR